MAVATVELIVFAAQAAIKLVQTGRKIYVEKTIEGEVVVPLPPIFQGLNAPPNRAVAYVTELDEGTTDDETARVTALREASAAYQSAPADGPEKAAAEVALVGLYMAEVAAGRDKTLARPTAELLAITVLRQWDENRSPFPTALQRVAGTLVEIAVDYFVHVPGALNAESKRGKAIRSFLTGLDDVDFADARWDAIVVSLFTSALDTLNENPGLFTDDPGKQALVTKIVAGVAADVKAGLASEDDLGDVDAQARLKQFGGVVLRSLLKNAGTAVIDDPSLLGVEGKGKRALVQEVGAAFLSLLLGDPKGGDLSLGAGLRRLASTDGLDKLIRAALKVAAEQKDLFTTGNQSVDAWLRGILTDLYNRGDKPLFDAEMFAEVAFSALSHGLKDLPALLKPGAGSAVLVDVARLVFDAVGGNEKNATWRTLQLSRSDLAGLFDGVFASLAMHTTWFSRRNKLETALGTAVAVLPLAVEVLASLGDGSLKALVRNGRLAGVLAAVLESGVLADLAGGDVKRIAKGVTAVLNAVWANGVSAAGRLLDEDTLLDVLAALVESGAVDDLFGDETAKVKAVVARLGPIFDQLREGVILTVAEMAEDLAEAA